VDHLNKVFSPSYITEVLKKRGMSLKKRYGQNFLINRDLAGKIIKHADLDESCTVLEIGPGLGTLTFLLSAEVRRVIAVEIDSGFCRYLEETAAQAQTGNVTVINKDFLALSTDHPDLSDKPDRVVSNFPYSAGIKSILKAVDDFESVVNITGTVQKELADRLIAKPGSKNYSYVSVYLQYVSRMRVLDNHISPANFFPSPEVVSSLIEVKPVRGTLPVEPEIFKRFVRASFANRRKNLVNNLKSADIRFDKEKLKTIVRERFRDIRIRAESLSVEDFTNLILALIRGR
jgi:16S rRNA (adenine1518-N6/adenine1519-N6)-dimethyltransferase